MVCGTYVVVYIVWFVQYMWYGVLYCGLLCALDVVQYGVCSVCVCLCSTEGVCVVWYVQKSNRRKKSLPSITEQILPEVSSTEAEAGRPS